MGSKYSSTQESMASILNALEQSLPGLSEVMRAEMPNYAKSEYDIAKEYSPKMAELQAKTMDKEGRELARVGRDLAKEEQLGASQNELDIIEGPGKELAKKAMELGREVDPEYYKSREAIGSAIEKSLGAIDPTKLTPGEMEEINRGIGRNAYAVGSPSSTIANAMTFGSALKDRRQEFSNAITSAASTLPGLKSGIDAFQAATQRSVMPNVGTAAYTGVQAPGVQNAQQLGMGAMGTAGQMEAIRKQKEKSGFDVAMQALDTGTKAIGNIMSI